MVATSWYSNFDSACFHFLQAPIIRHETHARMDHMCPDPGREMFDAHFILVYPWWLQNEAITTWGGGSRGQRPFGRFYLLIALAQAFLKIVREKVLPIVILNNTEPFIIHNTLGTKART